ncbi:MAG: sugar transferase [Pseudonocardiales bacterium]|nr:MAG: sugar transferase [Pseudonocardiales bacterium]
MRVAVITPVSGRHAHLHLQRRGLQAGTVRPVLHVVAAMGDTGVARELVGELSTVVHDVTKIDGSLPLARARNEGAQQAIAAGAELLVFLDVDCVPGSRMIERYVGAASVAIGADPPSLLCGPVAYLAPPPAGGYRLELMPYGAAGHPARPVPPDGAVIRGGSHELFWSLSFALLAPVWDQIGGFDERYTGYGAEDTDFGQRAALNGVRLDWIGGAWAYHQFHPSADPPVQHLADILRNAQTFRRRWGWWPMSGWLRAFEQRGIATYDADSDRWLAT